MNAAPTPSAACTLTGVFNGMALSLIIFDCDGVLVDSEIVAAQIESEKLAELGLEFSPEEISERFAGLTLTRIAEILTEETGVHFPERFVAVSYTHLTLPTKA